MHSKEDSTRPVQSFDKHETFKVSKGLDWDGAEGLCNLWSTFFKYPTKTFLKAFCSQIADGSNDSENSINSSKDGVDDSQTLIGVNSLNSNDQISTGAGHDISHNKDKIPSVEDEKSSSSDHSSNDYDSDNDDVGATPSRGKNAKSLLNLRQRTLPTAKNRSGKLPTSHPNTNPQVNLILMMMMLGLNLPEVKMERVC